MDGNVGCWSTTLVKTEISTYNTLVDMSNSLFTVYSSFQGALQQGTTVAVKAGLPAATAQKPQMTRGHKSLRFTACRLGFGHL